MLSFPGIRNTCAALLALSAALLGGAAPVSSGDEATNAGVPMKNEPIRPIPTAASLHPGKVALGRTLFHDPGLSHDGTISCSSCHDLKRGGCDQRVRSQGIGKAEGVINAPTVFNAALNFKQFWDGRAATLEEQLNIPLQNATEMGTTWPEVIGKLRSQPTYAKSFAAIYPDGIEPKNVRDALAEFERSLTTPNSRFDQYLRGNADALTAEEKEGYRKFKAFGCTSCHQGVNVGGNMFETLGAMADYFGPRGHVTRADFGRFNVTGREEDRFVFKVPGLRNVARTAPYFHDGSAARLEDAVAMMAKYQLGQDLSAEDVTQLVGFLESLTGEYEGTPL